MGYVAVGAIFGTMVWPSGMTAETAYEVVKGH